jgi:hypothetical protein
MEFLRLKKILFAILFTTVLMAGVSAFTLAETTISPLGNQPAGTPMTVTAAIDFPRKDLTSDTFPIAHDLVMTTGLSGAHWVPVLVLDDQQTRLPEENGGRLQIAGSYLSYPGTQDLKVRFTLSGVLPADASPAKDLLRVQEIDAQGNVFSTSSIAMPEAPLITQTEPVTPAKVTTTRKLPTPLSTPASAPTPAAPAGLVPAILAAAGGACIALKRR